MNTNTFYYAPIKNPCSLLSKPKKQVWRLCRIQDDLIQKKMLLDLVQPLLRRVAMNQATDMHLELKEDKVINQPTNGLN